MDKVKILSNSEDQCPYCNSKEIEFGILELNGDLANHLCTCKKCNRTFEQWYELKFIGHNVGAMSSAEAVVGDVIDYDKN